MKSVEEVAHLKTGRTATWIAIGVAATVGVVVLVLVLARFHNEGAI